VFNQVFKSFVVSCKCEIEAKMSVTTTRMI